MSLSWFSVVVDCEEPRLLADFWCRVLGYRIVSEADGVVAIAADGTTFPRIEFVLDETHVRRKSPLHIDLDPDDQDAEVARLVALGARRVDVGQAADATWVVLTDPEDNAFCVLAERG